MSLSDKILIGDVKGYNNNLLLKKDVKEAIKELKRELDDCMILSKNSREANLRFIRIRNHKIKEIFGSKLI